MKEYVLRHGRLVNRAHVENRCYYKRRPMCDFAYYAAEVARKNDKFWLRYQIEEGLAEYYED